MVAHRLDLTRVDLETALQVAHAQRDVALEILGRLVGYLDRVGGFMTPEDQAMLREAKATLVEAGRSVKP